MQGIHDKYTTEMTQLAFAVQGYKQLAEQYRATGRYALMGMANAQAEHLTNVMEEKQEMRNLIRGMR